MKTSILKMRRRSALVSAGLPQMAVQIGVRKPIVLGLGNIDFPDHIDVQDSAREQRPFIFFSTHIPGPNTLYLISEVSKSVHALVGQLQSYLLVLGRAVP